MNGEDLYNLYSEAQADMGCQIDLWEHIEQSERGAWELLAMKLKGIKL